MSPTEVQFLCFPSRHVTSHHITSHHMPVMVLSVANLVCSSTGELLQDYSSCIQFMAAFTHDCDDVVQGSVQRVSLTVPYSKTKETSNIALANVPNPRAGPMAAASQAPAAAATAAASRPSAYMAPARPIATPAANLATNPSQGFPSGLPQPTDPRRAAAAKSANPMPASQIGQYPIGRSGIAPAPASGYPMAASGLGPGGGSGQFGSALPADPRPDPRKAVRSASALRPAGGFPGLPFSFFFISQLPCCCCVSMSITSIVFE